MSALVEGSRKSLSWTSFDAVGSFLWSSLFGDREGGDLQEFDNCACCYVFRKCKQVLMCCGSIVFVVSLPTP